MSLNSLCSIFCDFDVFDLNTETRSDVGYNLYMQRCFNLPTDNLDFYSVLSMQMFSVSGMYEDIFHDCSNQQLMPL